jgi:hypothetical protein
MKCSCGTFCVNLAANGRAGTDVLSLLAGAGACCCQWDAWQPVSQAEGQQQEAGGAYLQLNSCSGSRSCKSYSCCKSLAHTAVHAAVC